MFEATHRVIDSRRFAINVVCQPKVRDEWLGNYAHDEGRRIDVTKGTESLRLPKQVADQERWLWVKPALYEPKLRQPELPRYYQS